MLDAKDLVRPLLLPTVLGLAACRPYGGESSSRTPTAAVPITWDERALATLEVPQPNAEFSPKAVPREYYERIPVRPIYRGYPVYAPGKEPPGYFEALKQREPEVLWDGRTRPRLQTEADWLSAGEIVFNAAIFYDNVARVSHVRDPEWYARVQPPITKDGILPYTSYVVREKGKLELGNNACAFCHTRVLADGTVVPGAQGNFPFDRAVAFSTRRVLLRAARNTFRTLFGAPWLKENDPAARSDSLTLEEIVAKFEAIPGGVVARHRASPDAPPAVPDLIGVRDRKYLDKSGLVQHRDIGDLMRYAALNNELDFISNFGGFIPAGKNYRELPEPTDPYLPGGGRYSDEQLYALARYVYALKPPRNPNERTAEAVRGEDVFRRSGCARCHTPPLYTNNRLTPALGFTVPAEHKTRYAVSATVVGTDPTLTLRTRRGTGYYKVPSLKGLWYRGPLEHSGSVATLEDWFDPRRLLDDYVPTGFKPHGIKTRAVKGHEFGLTLSDQEKKDLIAFLKTL